MKIQTHLPFSLFLFTILFSPSGAHDFQPIPSPSSGDGIGSPSMASDFADGVGSFFVESSPPSPAPAKFEWRQGAGKAPAPISDKIFASPEAAEETVRWCTVRGEFEGCQDFISVLNQLMGYRWKCVKRETTQECLASIKRGEVDLINLEAGLSYMAFLNYSMKAIANEIYCDKAKSYDAVAVVNRKACKENEKISLMDFKGHKSCHGGYSTAAGWNYPINHIRNLYDTAKMNDREIASSFFSSMCAPSEIGGPSICDGCSKENGSCPVNSLYSGHSGAFRCLVEEMGDIAFVKADTALFYSKEGPRNQSWSTKSIMDFMYLCPQGGCREINGYPGDCSLGTVPANVIMAHNSIPRKKKVLVLETLTNATLVDTLYAVKAGVNELLSPSTQGFTIIRKVTRSYLGNSASISQSIQYLNIPEATSSTVNPIPDEPSPSSPSSCIHCSQVMSLLSLFVLLMTL
ncbi:Transferrin [Quillaja saponaria]|uniref:Transferrin n=1 Tax=Quillaja saponaria TaxID=32244 RepID=A0AAD7M5S6_QUISA|nr:Transferrin [Quillaja saponaria]